MAAPSWRQSAVPLTDAQGDWTYNSAFPGGNNALQGSLVIFQLIQDGTTPGAVTLTGCSSHIQDLAGNAGTMTFVGAFAGSGMIQHIWIGRWTASASNTMLVGGTNSTSEDVYMVMHEIADGSDGTTLADVIENSSAGGTATSSGATAAISPPSVVTLGADRLAVALVGVNDDNAIGSFTGETGGDWSQMMNYAESGGTDGALALQTATMASAGTISGGSYTMAAADGWGVVAFAIKPVATGPSPQDVQVSGQDSAAAFGTVTPVPGGVNISVTGHDSVASFGSVTPLATVTTPITGLDSAAALGAVTAIPGNIGVSVGGLGSAADIGTVGILVGGTIIPVTGLVSATDFGAVTPDVSGGPQTVSVGGLGSTEAFGSVTPHAVIAIAVGGLDSAAAFGAVGAVPGNLDVVVAGLGSAAAFGSMQALPGNVTVAVAGRDSVADFGALGLAIRFEVAGLASTPDFGAVQASTTGGAQNVPISGLGSAADFGSVSPAPGVVIVPITGLGSAAAFGTAPRANQAFVVLGLDSAAQFGAVSPATGNTNIVIAGLGSAAQFGLVTASGGLVNLFDPAVHGGRHRR